MRWPVLLISLALAVALLAACGDDGDDDDSGGVDATPTATENDGVPKQTASDCPDPLAPVAEADMTKQYKAAPELIIDAGKEYNALVKTVHGDFTIHLRPDLAPQHVNSFVFLARDGYYNGVTFHRVIPGFVAQAGDPTGSGSGGPGYTIPAEFSDPAVARFERGTLGMARTSDPNSAGSQWFINYDATPSLDGQYTIFGEVTEGMEVVDCITPRDPSAGGALPPGDQIISIEITEA